VGESKTTKSPICLTYTFVTNFGVMLLTPHKNQAESLLHYEKKVIRNIKRGLGDTGRNAPIFNE